MVNRLFYFSLRLYVWCALHIYFKKIRVRGAANIPASGPVIFLANHQNALLDALVVATTAPRYCHFIARADVFKSSGLARLLSLLNIRPVYRMRDGLKSIPNNKQTFTWASSVLLRNECLLFFPEGNHSLLRRVRPLSKGFTRIVAETLEKNPSLNLRIVPVGINYTDHTGFRGSVSLYYGQPVEASGYKNNLPALRTAMEETLKTLTIHVADEATYHDVISKLERSTPDYLDPEQTNRSIRLIESGQHPEESAHNPHIKKSPARLLVYYPIYFLCVLINAVPLVIWKWLKKKITDAVFIGTFRFAVGITVVPVTYAFIVGIAAVIATVPVALLTGMACVLSLPVYRAILNELR
jgi:1-acyl-sn-glycerol-3-phosphate acyltransferase